MNEPPEMETAQDSYRGSLCETVDDVLTKLCENRFGYAVFTRALGQPAAGIVLLVGRQKSFEAIGPVLGPIGREAIAKDGPSGSQFSADGSATIEQMMDWLDLVPNRCACGPIITTIAGAVSQSFLFAFTGPICGRVKEALKRVGIDL